MGILYENNMRILWRCYIDIMRLLFVSYTDNEVIMRSLCGYYADAN